MTDNYCHWDLEFGTDLIHRLQDVLETKGNISNSSIRFRIVLEKEKRSKKISVGYFDKCSLSICASK
jgi:hypothetical protein